MHPFNPIRILSLFICGLIINKPLFASASDEKFYDATRSTQTLKTNSTDPLWVSDPKEWLPQRLHAEERLARINEFIQQEENILIKNNPSDIRDYGYSIARLNWVHQDYLSSIQKRFQTSDQRPLTIDIGAGHGFMTWKTLLAGGKCHVIEPQKPTLDLLLQNVRKIQNFLLEDETVKSLCKAMQWDVFNFFEKCPRMKEKYDFCWAGNLIHLFKPSQVEELTSIFYNLVKPGGMVYVTAHTGAGIPAIVERFHENKVEGIRFPGYIFVNKIIYRKRQLDPDTHQIIEENCKVEIEEVFSVIDEPMAPMDGEKHGFYGHETPEITWLKTDKSNIFKRNVHTTIHCFDPDTLRMLFESKGFEVEEAYYMRADGSKVTIPPSLSDLKENPYTVAIKAKKPTRI